ncbi:MAG: glycosyltransferase family 2 protein, partial [Chthoniobacterales bacterium]
DEDFLDANGARSNPFLKPDWNPELFLAQNYINHFGVYRTALLREIGGFREGFEGSQDYDLTLRCIERLEVEQIRHIPRVLYHWRMIPGSLAKVRDAKPYAKKAARRALADHLRRRRIAARVEPCPENIESHRVIYAVPEPAPLVSVVTYGDAGDGPQRSYGTYSAFESLRADEGCANFGEMMNRAAAKASGSVLVFLKSDMEIVEAEWLHELVGEVARENVGAVGARIWSPEGTLQHSGLVLGLNGVAGDAHRGLPRGHPGFFNRTLLQRNCSAVSAACFGVRTSLFRELGGFNDKNLARSFHDVDFCLRAAERGFQIVWTPYVNPIQHGPPGEEDAETADAQYMQRRWGAKLRDDPFYSPSLTLKGTPFELAFPPRWLSQPSLPA